MARRAAAPNRRTRLVGPGVAAGMSSDSPRDDSPRPDNADDGSPKRHPTGNAEKDPADWTTGDEPMTGAQASYLKTLSEEAGEAFDDSLTKAEASMRIDALRAQTGRGQ